MIGNSVRRSEQTENEAVQSLLAMDQVHLPFVSKEHR
jgi:hypothetical protein